MPCLTCDHTLQKICDDPRVTYCCPRCGSIHFELLDYASGRKRMVCEPPKVVGYLRSFHRMISDSPEGRALRSLAHTEGITESILKPGDRL